MIIWINEQLKKEWLFELMNYWKESDYMSLLKLEEEWLHELIDSWKESEYMS